MVIIFHYVQVKKTYNEAQLHLCHLFIIHLSL